MKFKKNIKRFCPHGAELTWDPTSDMCPALGQYCPRGELLRGAVPRMDCKVFHKSPGIMHKICVVLTSISPRKRIYSFHQRHKRIQNPRRIKNNCSTITSTPGMNASFSHHVLLNWPIWGSIALHTWATYSSPLLAGKFSWESFWAWKHAFSTLTTGNHI